MNTINKLTTISAALLMAASISSAYADDGEMTQTRTQTQERLEFNLQTPTSDFGQAHNREQLTVMNQNQNQYQYMYNNESPENHSNIGEGSMNRYNTTNRYMQGSNASGSAMQSSINRQAASNRSMGGGGRR